VATHIKTVDVQLTQADVTYILHSLRELKTSIRAKLQQDEDGDFAHAYADDIMNIASICRVREGIAPPPSPQIRTCGTIASGSSVKTLATLRVQDSERSPESRARPAIHSRFVPTDVWPLVPSMFPQSDPSSRIAPSLQWLAWASLRHLRR